MDTKNTKFKRFEISKEESKNLKGGYEDNGIGGGGVGGNGFVIWDDLDPRDDNFAFSNVTLSAFSPKNFKKK